MFLFRDNAWLSQKPTTLVIPCIVLYKKPCCLGSGRTLVKERSYFNYPLKNVHDLTSNLGRDLRY